MGLGAHPDPLATALAEPRRSGLGACRDLCGGGGSAGGSVFSDGVGECAKALSLSAACCAAQRRWPGGGLCSDAGRGGRWLPWGWRTRLELERKLTCPRAPAREQIRPLAAYSLKGPSLSNLHGGGSGQLSPGVREQINTCLRLEAQPITILITLVDLMPSKR